MKKFKGEFNWYGESHIFYTTTTSIQLAKRNLFSQLANTLGKSATAVKRYYDNKPNGFSIKEVAE